MVSRLEQEGLTISSSTTPILRAGYSNFIFVVFAPGIILLNQVLSDIGAPPWVRGAVLVGLCLTTLKAYACSVSRIYVRDGKTLVLVSPVSESAVEVSDIVEVRIYGIPSSMTVFLKIRTRSSRWPMLRSFVAVATNFGPYPETRTRLLADMADLVHAEDPVRKG